MSKAHDPKCNRLLAPLAPEEQDRIFPHLRLVEMPVGNTVYESGKALRHAYFPADCIVSLSYVLASGATTAVSVIGNEGMIGVALLMGGETTPHRTMVQSGGHAFRLEAQRLKEEFRRSGALQNLLLRYTQVLITQMAQTAVCSRHHSVDQRLAHWLLLFLDRLSSATFSMTQESLSSMLGVRREGVTEAAGRLQREGIIEYHRGRLTVLDREQLERSSCECYGVVRRETDRLLR